MTFPVEDPSDTDLAHSKAAGPSWQRLTAAVRVNPHGVHLHVVRLRAGDMPAVIASRQDRNAYPTYDHGPRRGPRMSPSGSSAECVYLETYPRLSGTQSKLVYSMSIADHGCLSTLSHGELTYGPETF